MTSPFFFLVRTRVPGLRAHSGNPEPSHLQIFNLITFAKPSPAPKLRERSQFPEFGYIFLRGRETPFSPLQVVVSEAFDLQKYLLFILFTFVLCKLDIFEVTSKPKS